MYYLLIGAPSLSTFFWGMDDAFAASTFPVIFKVTIDCVAFEYTRMLLLIVPTLWVLYFTTIVAESPGNTGCLGHAGIVQPQLERTLVRIRGSLPSFLKVNSQLPSSFWEIVP